MIALRKILGYTLLLLLCNCEDDTDGNGVLNESSRYAICNQMLTSCVDGNGRYSLFGYKWGSDDSFSPNGYNAIGPKEAGGIITFSFQEQQGLVNTHAQIDLSAGTFADLLPCAKDKIREALLAWSDIAQITFLEEIENSTSDIRFFVADIRQSGIGYPNFTASPCDILGGDIIIQKNVKYEDCDSFYNFVLHETGHTLGLGHVQSQNIMNPNFEDFDFDGIQSGDQEGIIEIYGEK